MNGWLAGRKAVVPIDFGDQTEYAIDSVVEIMGDTSQIIALYVAPDLNIVEPGIAWGEITDESREAELRRSFADQFSDSKYAGIRFEVAFGDAGHGIAEFAEREGAGLIVMPSHGRTGLQHLVIGSVAERVVRYAHCPVLVLRR